MKFFTAIFILTVSAFACVLSGTVPEKNLEEIPSKDPQVDASFEIPDDISVQCSAAGSCRGFGGGKLCNDRCKNCYSGTYKSGACCGTGWQTCCCYHS